MLLRMSNLFLRTLREDPADAEVISHKLLVRAGYVRRVSPGVYSWLPLGKLVLDNVTQLIREEMVRIGDQEVLFPSLLPREPYEASGRWVEYGDDMFRLTDRRGVDYLLGPTHEEMFTLMVKGEYSSYKEFPVSLFQVATKFRDEPRARAGIIRGREFIMKDAYSFDLSVQGLQRSYQAHRNAYKRVFDRLRLDYRIVLATPGAMGGSVTEEFLAVTPIGEDTYVSCTNCDYAANTEAVKMAPPEVEVIEYPPMTEVETPATPTIDSLVSLLNTLNLGRTFSPAETLKNIAVKVTQPGEVKAELVVVGVPGDREVDMKRLSASVYPATVELLDDDDWASSHMLTRGYIGPRALREHGIKYLLDPRVQPGTAWVTGADQPDRHVLFAVVGRDFEPDGYIEAAEVRAGDLCPECGGVLTIARGIEIGQIFQLGTVYTDTFEVDALGPDGKPIRIVMGSYGIGVSRAIGAVAEQTSDDRGLCWPREIAPADVHIMGMGKDNQIEVALRIGEELTARGVRVLVDDRTGVSSGVKFADAELIGIPTILVVGRGLADGLVELRDRRSGRQENVPVSDIFERVADLAADRSPVPGLG
jgi:prolyl-tRNA synthetase